MTELRCQSCPDFYLREPHIVRDYQNTFKFVISLQPFFLSSNKRYVLNQYPLLEQTKVFLLMQLTGKLATISRLALSIIPTIFPVGITRESYD